MWRQPACSPHSVVPVRDGDHLVIDGRWPFNSGCVHAEWYQTGIIVMDGDRPAPRPDGTPDRRFAYFPAAAAEILDTWHATGLRGTGSHDIEVHQLRIPTEHSAAPMLDPARQGGPLWQLGFFPLLAVLMSGFPLGVGRRALDELTQLAPAKRRGASPTTVAEDPRVQFDLGRAEAALQSARTFVHHTLDDAWTTIETGTPVTTAQLGRITWPGNRPCTPRSLRSTSPSATPVPASCTPAIHSNGASATSTPPTSTSPSAVKPSAPTPAPASKPDSPGTGGVQLGADVLNRRSGRERSRISRAASRGDRDNSWLRRCGMGRPRIPRSVVAPALEAVARGATQAEAAVVAGCR